MKTITVSDNVWEAIQNYIVQMDLEHSLTRAMTESDVVELALTFMATADSDFAGQASNHQLLVASLKYLGLIA
jgi:hypothetical protein